MTRYPTAKLLTCLVVFFAIVACMEAAWQGPALDEFWSLHLADPRVPLPDLFQERWLRDPHPPLANLLYRLAAIAGGQDINRMRLMLNVPALAALACFTILIASTARRNKSFYYVFSLSVLGLPHTIQYFADFRTYFVQIVALTGGIQYLFYNLSEPEAGRQTPRVCMVHVFGVLCLSMALWLHFVTALLFAPVVGLVTCVLAASRRGAAARRVGGTAVVALALVGLFAGIQTLMVADSLDVRWIQTSTKRALWIMAQSVVKGAMAAPVAIALLLALAARSHWRSRMSASAVKSSLAAPQAQLAGILAASILAGAAALLVLNLRQPIVIERYLIAWEVMIAAAVAAVAGEALVKRPVWLIAHALWAASVVGYVGSQHMRNERWGLGLRKAAALAATCPTSRIFATSHWRFTSFRDSRTAERESAVSLLGYRMLADKAGVAVELLDHRSRVLLRPDPHCSTILWVSHVAMLDRPFSSPADALSRGDIVLERQATAAFVPGLYGNNMLLVIGPERRQQ